MWLLRWETPFPPEFLKVVSSSVLLSPFFKFKITRNLRIRSPRATATQVLCKLNAQIKAKRTTQRRLGQAITSAPKNPSPPSSKRTRIFQRIKEVPLLVKRIKDLQRISNHRNKALPVSHYIFLYLLLPSYHPLKFPIHEILLPRSILRFQVHP